MKGSPEILIINSDKRELKKAEAFLNLFFEENNLSKRNFNKVLLCLSEAVLNSIDHGNQNDTEKRVAIQADCQNELINITIRDEGNGFDYENIEDPTKDKNIRNESGRGIHIIKSFSKELNFKEKGKSIQFKIECK